MTRLRACYPARVNDPEMWKANTKRYFAELGDAFEHEAIVMAFEGAWRKHRTFFPALGEIEELCKLAEKGLVAQRPQLTEGEPFNDSPEGEAARAKAFSLVSAVLRDLSADAVDAVKQGSAEGRVSTRELDAAHEAAAIRVRGMVAQADREMMAGAVAVNNAEPTERPDPPEQKPRSA